VKDAFFAALAVVNISNYGTVQQNVRKVQNVSLHVSANPGHPQGNYLYILEGTTLLVLFILHPNKIFTKIKLFILY
jgi:hypothetical protein